ncbi:hypothetical protein FZ983_27405 [Azospirillum sp. B21]|uniref:hypothetical protein n=1 Tax=Azospirillum sp. B21 TaxID=2607496 RepID=UPI0011EED724|nr:hypothetical protein [Azospirillum sp. B21]KAA0574629.1 hypothetical protein FZ983_27405 [Azospirillum sp. B21]
MNYHYAQYRMKTRIYQNCRITVYFAVLSLAGCVTDEKQALFYDNQADFYLYVSIFLGLVTLATVLIAFRQSRTSAWIHNVCPAIVTGVLSVYAGSTSLDYRLEARRYACAALSQAARGTPDLSDCRTLLTDWDTARKRELIDAKQKEHARLEKIIR